VPVRPGAMARPVPTGNPPRRRGVPFTLMPVPDRDQRCCDRGYGSRRSFSPAPVPDDAPGEDDLAKEMRAVAEDRGVLTETLRLGCPLHETRAAQRHLVEPKPDITKSLILSPRRRWRAASAEW
jgi:hypothetical protein